MTPYSDWYVTIMFYAALHRVQALLHHRGYDDTQCDLHTKTRDLLRNDVVLRLETDLRNHYRDLSDDSRAARYRLGRFSQVQVSDLRERYENLKQRVGQLML
jgi:hypothetical protein